MSKSRIKIETYLSESVNGIEGRSTSGDNYVIYVEHEDIEAFRQEILEVSKKYDSNPKLKEKK